MTEKNIDDIKLFRDIISNPNRYVLLPNKKCISELSIIRDYIKTLSNERYLEFDIITKGTRSTKRFLKALENNNLENVYNEYIRSFIFLFK